MDDKVEKNTLGLYLKEKHLKKAVHTVKSQHKLEKKCIKDNKLGSIKDLKRIGSSSAFGEVYSGCYPSDCSIKLAVKQVPLKQDDFNTITSIESKKALNRSSVWSELLLLKLVSVLNTEDICPHLPQMFAYYICNDCKYRNKNIQSEDPNCVIIVTELADGDLQNLLMKIQPDVEVMKNIYFQIYMGIYCMNKFFGIYHEDLHQDNVLYHIIPKGGYIRYIIDDVSIVIPNIGYLALIWDFGLSVIPGKIENNRFRRNKKDKRHKAYGKVLDYQRVTSMLYKDDTQRRDDYDRLGGLLYYLLMKFKHNPKKLLLTFGKLLNVDNVPENEIVATYNTDKKIISDNSIINKYIKKMISISL